ncbi:MAG: lysozyme [Pseudomonadota bacterium]
MNALPEEPQQQPGSKKPWLVAVAMSAIAIGSLLTKASEGVSYTAYPDPVSHSAPWTICYGHTQGVVPGMVATQAQCDTWLTQDYAEHAAVVARCIHVPLNVNQAASLYDSVHNLGPAVVCGSTLQARANADDYAGMCNQLPRWNKAGRRVWPGLTTRRLNAQELCLYPPINKALIYPAARN